MALGPLDLALSNHQKAEVARLEERIDNELRHLNTGKLIKIRIGQVLDKRIINELIDRYKTAGWSRVEYDSYDELRLTT